MGQAIDNGGTVITPWLVWFLETLEAALQRAISQVQADLNKTAFWQQNQAIQLLPEQILVLNHLLEIRDQDTVNTISANSTSKCDTRLCRLTVLFEYLDRLPESETFPRS